MVKRWSLGDKTLTPDEVSELQAGSASYLRAGIRPDGSPQPISDEDLRYLLTEVPAMRNIDGTGVKDNIYYRDSIEEFRAHNDRLGFARNNEEERRRFSEDLRARVEEKGFDYLSAAKQTFLLRRRK